MKCVYYSDFTRMMHNSITEFENCHITQSLYRNYSSHLAIAFKVKEDILLYARSYRCHNTTIKHFYLENL